MKQLTMTRREQGMTLLESLLALMALVTLTTLCALVLRHHSRQSAALSTAQLLKKTGHSLRTYMEDHPNDIKLKEISKSKLINAGYFLPQQPNAYQQIHNLQVVQEGTQTRVCVITQGGNQIPPGDWARMAPLFEGYGGYCAQKTGNIIGWQQPGDAKLIPSLKPGHLVLCYPLQTSQLPPLVSAADRLLYRQKIPTHPHYQQMKTHLNLQQHAIDFKAPQQQGTISAQRVVFQHITPTGTHRASIALTSQGAGTAYQLTLENPEQHHVQISPSAVQITAPSLVTSHSHFKYDAVHRVLTLNTIPPHYGLQWHREWHQLPYHHLPYHQLQTAAERQNDLNHAAQRICLLEQPAQLVQPATKSNLYPHLGRMFIVGNFYQQQSTVFICGKSKLTPGASPLAYPIFSSPSPLEKNSTDPRHPVEHLEKKQMTGLKFQGIHPVDQADHQKKLQLYLFLYDAIEKILCFLDLENTISIADKVENKKNELMNFIQEIEDYRKVKITLETIKKNPYLNKLTEDYKKLSSPYFDKNQEKFPDLFINYFLHRSIKKTLQETTGDSAFLNNLLTQLNGCQERQDNPPINSPFKEYYQRGLNPQKVNEVIQNKNVTTFLSQCLAFKKISPYRWMQTVYVLSTAEYSGKEPLYELNLTDLTSK